MNFYLTCARAIGNLLSICLGVNILSSSTYFISYLASDSKKQIKISNKYFFNINNQYKSIIVSRKSKKAVIFAIGFFWSTDLI